MSNIIATNKKALYDYAIEDKYLAGLKLLGWEVKSCKAGSVNLKGSYVVIALDQIPRLIGCHISPYKYSAASQDPLRSRELLLHKKEVSALIGKLKEKRYTLVPLNLYNQKGIIKLELGLAVGKKQYEKRETIKKRDVEREIGRRLKR